MHDLERLTSALAPLYRPERELARSALGATWLASTDGEAAEVCVLAPDVVAAMTDANAFAHAMERVARVSHPALVPLLGAGATGSGEVYFATRHVDAASARERLEQEGPLPPGEVATLGARAADALAAAHAAGAVHGAVTPASLRLTRDGVRVHGLGVWQALVDAGIARSRAAELTGAMAYLSPEQQRAASPDGRSDVYGLGASLYELLTGKAPYGGRTTSFTIAAVLSDDPAPDSGAGSGNRVTDTVLRAIEKAPEDRWPSAAAFARALREGTPGSAQEAVEPAVQARRPLWIVAVVLIVAVAVVAALVRG